MFSSRRVTSALCPARSIRVCRSLVVLALVVLPSLFVPADTANVEGVVSSFIPAPSTNFLFLPFDTATSGGDWLTLMTSAFDHHYPDYTCSQGLTKPSCQQRGMQIALWEGEIAKPVRDTAGIPYCYQPGDRRVLSKEDCGWISGYQGVTGESAVFYDGHDGYDWAISGTDVPILAAASGTVTFVGDDGLYGWTVVIDHLNGYTTHYSHLQRGARNTAVNTPVCQISMNNI